MFICIELQWNLSNKLIRSPSGLAIVAVLERWLHYTNIVSII